MTSLTTPLLSSTPTGYEYSHTNQRMWRKNRAKTTRANCIGVDLNRNYDYKWGGKGTSKSDCSEIYRGTKGFSEPESRAVSDFILARASQFKVRFDSSVSPQTDE